MREESERLLRALQASADAQRHRENEGLAEAVSSLETWQKRRLQNTYADLAAQERYREATRFFTEELYAPPNIQDRDHDLRRMSPYMIRMLPPDAVNTVAVAMEVQALTLELDLGVSRWLAENNVDPERMTDDDYATAYCQIAEGQRRAQQIDLILEVGRDLDRLVHNPFIFTTLKLCRTPARLLGLMTLHEFLIDGFTSFRAMHGAEDFLATIERRERLIMQDLLAGRNECLKRSWTSGE